MSMWTYVTGSIVIDTFSKNAVDEVREFLKTAPEITGSEQNVEYYLTQPYTPNTFSSYFDHEKNEWVEEEYDTRVIITLYGCLRDRDIETTKKEIEKFLEAVSNVFDNEQKSIEMKTILVTDYEKFFSFQ